MGQLWSRAVGGHEDNNQSPIAVAIRDNNSEEVVRLLKEGVVEEQEEPLLCLAARFNISGSQIALFYTYLINRWLFKTFLMIKLH